MSTFATVHRTIFCKLNTNLSFPEHVLLAKNIPIILVWSQDKAIGLLLEDETRFFHAINGCTAFLVARLVDSGETLYWEIGEVGRRR